MLVEEPRILKGLDPKAAIMLYGGNSVKKAAFYDAVKEICDIREGLKGMASCDLVSVVLGVLAGVDFFETDYPLDLASKNQALILDARCDSVSSDSLSHLKS